MEGKTESGFQRMKNEDGTFDSTCVCCSLKIATSQDGASLEWFESTTVAGKANSCNLDG